MNGKQFRTQTLRLAPAALAVVMGAWTVPAAAVTATVVTSVHLRAGPSVFYPSVVMMPPGAPVQVYACEQGYNWCDVQFGPERGWVDAAYLQAPTPSGPVIIANSGIVLGVAVAPFVLNTYWANYYPARPWYPRHAYYYNYWHRYPHGRPPPPPPPVVRPPPRPPGYVRPPAGGKPPGGRPPGGGKPPGNPPPKPTPRPAPGTGQ